VSLTHRGRLTGPTGQIMAGLLVGIAIGYLSPALGTALKPVADAFLRLVKMIVAPLVFSTLVVGVGGTASLKTMGRIGLKAIVYFEVATTFALIIGLGLANAFRPGAGMPLIPGGGKALAQLSTAEPRLPELVLRMIPASIVDAFARGDILQIVVFATLFGLAAAAIGPKARPLIQVFEVTAQVMFKLTGYVMLAAPVGVCAAIASTVAGSGPSVLLALGKLIAVMYLGLAIFVVLVVGVVSRAIGVPVGAFLSAIRAPFLIAFTTASSEAALPKAFETMEQFGVPRHIVGFVLPTGYTFNLDGTTMYLSLASVFVAQLAGVHMTWGQQIVMMLTLMLTSKGVAGVPRAALVVLTATLAQFNLPLEGAAVLLGIDQVLDMGRTSINVVGNCLATVVVARWEGSFDEGRMKAFASARSHRAA
jgi:proton glutamate symport protein